jgi:hypothetical protein
MDTAAVQHEPLQTVPEIHNKALDNVKKLPRINCELKK